MTNSCRIIASLVLAYVSVLGILRNASGEIPKPADAPQPLSPIDAARTFRVPDGFRVELVASEPLVREPTGVCWDSRGRLFVCELHGFNLAGQLDIEALNKTGELDHVVRRVEANDEVKKQARAETYGTVKLLVDSDGDGQPDKCEVWADRLPPCHGVCPAGDGIIVTCAPDIVFLADRDGDGKAEVREVLFTGFPDDMLERSISCPQWGIDHWIYVGRGSAACTVTGPRLAKPVQLPYTDFRFKPDGSAIEPVVGSSLSMGFAITESGDRYVMNTNVPAIFVAPIPWRYLTRNPNIAAPPLEAKATDYNRAFPTSTAHPWRRKRAEDPGFADFYTKRYGAAEAAAEGFFTSCCSPLVYQGHLLPGLNGQYFVCEPAQNLVHRAEIVRDGLQVKMHREQSEQQSEFLTSSDSWFHPIALSHGPDDAIYVTDFYREIIEDYSAIPRYLQQQYELNHGQDRGRIWRVTHRGATTAKSPDMSSLPATDLIAELGSPNFWRRETARRLLAERDTKSVVSELMQVATSSADPSIILSALYALQINGPLDVGLLIKMLAHPEPTVRVHALRLAEERLRSEPPLREAVLNMVSDAAPNVQLQLALTLGESDDSRIVPALAELAREHGDDVWMSAAILSSLAVHAGDVLAMLTPLARDKRNEAMVGHSFAILQPLCSSIAARCDAEEVSQILMRIAALEHDETQIACLTGLLKGMSSNATLSISEAARKAIRELSERSSGEVRVQARRLVALLKLETQAERDARFADAARQIADVLLPTSQRLDALADLSAEDDLRVVPPMLDAHSNATPKLKESIINALLSNRQRLPLVLDAVETKIIAKSAISALQRSTLTDNPDRSIRQRARRLLTSNNNEKSASLARFIAALKEPRSPERGEAIFREKCASCHAMRNIGFAVGPDLAAEFQRAEETIVRDIVTPSDTIAAGYTTYLLETVDGQILSGLIVDESANSIILRQPGGKEQSVLRKNIQDLKTSTISLMPEDLEKTLTPQDVADIIAWMRN